MDRVTLNLSDARRAGTSPPILGIPVHASMDGRRENGCRIDLISLQPV
jgi:hypothetical protein